MVPILTACNLHRILRQLVIIPFLSQKEFEPRFLPFMHMFTKIILVFKMIGWFFIEVFELLTGKRKFLQDEVDQDDSVTNTTDKEKKDR